MLFRSVSKIVSRLLEPVGQLFVRIFHRGQPGLFKQAKRLITRIPAQVGGLADILSRRQALVKGRAVFCLNLGVLFQQAAGPQQLFLLIIQGRSALISSFLYPGSSISTR